MHFSILTFLVAGAIVTGSSHCSTSNNFTISPRSVNSTEGSTVSFHCRVEGAVAIIWHVNETVSQQLPRALRTTINYSERNSNKVFYLTVTAQPIINNSRIVCIGIFADRRIYSEPAILLIQGQLQQVDNLTVEIATDLSLIIQWIAPFSLTITSPYEVTYCVDVYNSTDQTLETSICGLNETQYRYEAMSDPSPCDGVDIYVIPVNSAGNGSSNHIIGTFYDKPAPLAIPHLKHGITFISEDEILIQISNIDHLNAYCYCSVCTRLLNGHIITKRCYNASCYDDQVFICTKSLELNQMYALMINLYNSAGSSTSNGSLKLSTHDVQSITFNTTMMPRTVQVDVHFIRNSSARGCLLIMSQAECTRYFAIEKDSGREIKDLPQGDYVARGYDIERNGVPDHPIPAVIYNVTISEGLASWNKTEERSGCFNRDSKYFNQNISIQADGAGSICINCTISSTSDTLGCVVLLHSVNDLNNITVRIVNKTLQQVYCIYVGRRDVIYSVAVFEWECDYFISSQPVTVIEFNDTFDQIIDYDTEIPLALQIVLGVAGGFVLVIMSCVILILSTIKVRYFKPKMKREDVEYEDVVMNENMAYDVPKECSHDSTGSVIYETIN